MWDNVSSGTELGAFVDKEVSEGSFPIVSLVWILVGEMILEFPVRQILLDPPRELPMSKVVGTFVTTVVIRVA